MSVQKNHYEIIGAKFDYDEYHDALNDKSLFCSQFDFEIWLDNQESKYRDSAFKGIQHHNDITVIADGMNGEYVYVGVVLSKSGNYGNIKDFVRTDPIPEDVSGLIYKELGLDVCISNHSFTHYR